MLRVSVEVEDGDAAGHEAVAQGADLLEAGGEADAAEAGVRVEAEAGEPGAVLAAAEADDDGPRVLSLGLAAVLVLPLHLRTLGRGGQGSPQPLGTTFGIPSNVFTGNAENISQFKSSYLCLFVQIRLIEMIEALARLLHVLPQRSPARPRL